VPDETSEHLAMPPVAARPVFAPMTPAAPRPLELDHVSRRDALWDLSLVVVVALLFPVGLNLAGHLFAGAEQARWPAEGYFTAAKWLDALLVVVLTAYLVRRHHLSSAAFGLQTEALGRQVLWAAGTLVGAYAALIPTVMMIGLLVLLFPELHRDLDRRLEFIEVIPIHRMGDTLLLLGAVAIHEELLFRGLLMPYLRRVGCGWGGAVVVSASLFAALHVAQGWLGIVQVFPIGVALAVFFVLSRSLLAVILAHFAFDFLQFQLIRVLLPWIEQNWPPA